MARFDKFVIEKNAKRSTNDHTEAKEEETQESTVKPPSIIWKVQPKQESDRERPADVSDNLPRKKKRKVEPVVDDDAAYAAKLQAEENIRARPTRGGATRKAAPIKKKKSTKKKTSSKVRAEDDSDIDGSGSDEKKINRKGGFHAS